MTLACINWFHHARWDCALDVLYHTGVADACMYLKQAGMEDKALAEMEDKARKTCDLLRGARSELDRMWLEAYQHPWEGDYLALPEATP